MRRRSRRQRNGSRDFWGDWIVPERSSLPRRLLKEKSVLEKLSQNQVEQALQWLSSPVQEPPPQELESLNQVEWFLLSRLLESLLLEKQHHRLQ